MKRKIYGSLIWLVKKSYEEGLSVSNIATRLGLSYNMVYVQTAFLSRKFDTYHEYQKHLAQQKGFRTKNEYQLYLAQQRINPKTGEQFKTLHEYQEHLAQQKGFRNLSEYQSYFAIQKGFRNLSEYKEYLARKRQNGSKNKYLSNLIREKLKESGNNQSWLAREANVSFQTISSIVQGKHLPREELRKKVYCILGIEQKNLDDAMNN